MKSRRRIREAHRGAGLVVTSGLLLLALTGLGLQHPGWFGAPSLSPTVLAADPTMARRLLRAAPFLVEESIDGGATWRELPLHLAPARPVALVFAPGSVWLLGDVDLLVSRDGGRIWESLVVPAPDERFLGLTVDTTGRPLLTTPHRAWRRADSGTWTPLWYEPPTTADRVRTWMRKLHSGHWGPPVVARVVDGVAVLVVATVVAGLFLVRRRRRGAGP